MEYHFTNQINSKEIKEKNQEVSQYSESSWIIQEVKKTGRKWLQNVILWPGFWILNLFGGNKSERN